MSTTTTTAPVKEQHVNEVSVQGQVIGQSPVVADYDHASEVASLLKGMKRAVKLNGDYLVFEKKGDSKKVVFVGYKEINVKDKATGELNPLDAVVLMDEDFNQYVNAGAALVNIFANSNLPQNTPVEIVYQGRDGNVKLYDVHVLTQG